MNEKSNFLCLNAGPNEASTHTLDHGATVLHAPSGTFIHDDGGGDISVTVPIVTGVAVANWVDVAEFNETRSETTLIRHLRFYGGGTAEVVCDCHGSIMSVVAEHVNAIACSSGLVILSTYQRAAQSAQGSGFPSALSGNP